MAPSTLRQTVLRAAIDYIAEHGPDGLSFRQVAAAAGVSHQAPYHHFADRKGIFQAIALEGFTQLAAAMRDVDADSNGERTLALLERYVEFALDHRGHFRVMFRSELCEMESNPDLQRVADEGFGVLVDHVQTVLGPSATLSDIRAHATAMWSLAHGLATLLIDGPLEAKVGEIADRRAFIRAVGAQTGLGKPLPPAHDRR